MYQNGVVITSVAATTLAIPASPVVGVQNSYYLHGMIDEVRISSVARSSNWIWACWLNMASNPLFNACGPISDALEYTTRDSTATACRTGGRRCTA